MGALEFGQLIKQARLRRGWQQQELADRIGVDRGYISTIENGKRNWPQSYIKPLADALNLDQVDMAIAAGLVDPPQRRATEQREPEDPGREELIERLGRLYLTDERRHMIAGLFDSLEDFDRKSPRIVTEQFVDEALNHFA